jgi:alpha-L-rhamnosidase
MDQALSQLERISGTPIQPDDPNSRVEWQARWLQDPVFESVPYRELLHSGRKPELNGEIQNVHTFFRRELSIEDKPIRQVRLYITADDCYKLYIDGGFVGLGPAPAQPFDYPYNAWDVTAQLAGGQTHCVGVHAFYQGMHSLTFPSGDNLQGLLLQLEITFEDGSTSTLVSDEQWRCHRTDAYEHRQVIGYQTAFSEHIDLRKLPIGWAEPGFDDHDWHQPLVGDLPERYVLSAQQTPPLTVHKRPPVRVTKKGDGHYFIDFGTELAGETAFVVTGDAGHVVEIRHGEELLGPDAVRYDMRCNCEYQEFCTLSGRPDELLTFFDYKGFRYAEVLNWPHELTAQNVWAHERHYPFPQDASHFESSNPLLNDIWQLCRNGVRVGTLDLYLDCPTREKGGFMGDGFVTGISHLLVTGDARLLRKFLKDVANTHHFCPGLHSTAPNYVVGEIAEYSLLWPVLLEYYHQWTGDIEFVREMEGVLEGLIRYYADYENADGLLQDVFSPTTKRCSVLVDWPANLRDDYDDPHLMGHHMQGDEQLGVVNTMVQGFYRNALMAADRLATLIDATRIKQFVTPRIDRVRDAAISQLRDPASGRFVDRVGSDHSALHANVTPLMSGMVDADQRDAVVDVIRRKRLSCGVYFSWFVLKALYDAGESELAYDLITSRDLHSWHSMLEAGATTCMEAWAPDLKWNTSWCHPWSSAPIYMVSQELFGLKPAQPGWQAIRFAPRPPVGLAHASIRIPTPVGAIEARFEQADAAITHQLNVPADCPIECDFGSSGKQVRINGEVVTGQSSKIALRGGEHTIEVTRMLKQE